MAGLSLFGALIAGGLWWSVGEEPYWAEVSSRATIMPSAEAGGAAAAIQDLILALEAGDPSAAAATAPNEDSEARGLLSAVAENARDLRITDLSGRYVDEVGAVTQGGTWTAAVELTWAVEGFDRQPSRAEVLFAFAPDDNGVAITGLGGGDRVSPLWMRERLSVRRTPTALVMAAGARADRAAQIYLERVRRAIPVIQRVLPTWRPSVVVEVPETAAGLDDSLNAVDGTYARIAAVTATADGSGLADVPVRVFVNPEVTGRSRGAGAQVVISHELVHAATDATTVDIDPWLREGFADYVALRDVDLPFQVTAARAIASVRREGVPERLPEAADFDTAAGHLEAAYELAWLACVEIAEQAGQRGLVRAYEEAGAGASTVEALAAVGLTQGDLLRGWQRRLIGLAG